MSGEASGFAPPAFNADEALVGLKRQLRELRPLAERGSRFELRGCVVIEIAASGEQIDARLARRPAANPEWAAHPLRSSLEVRRFVDTVRQQLRRWLQDD